MTPQQDSAYRQADASAFYSMAYRQHRKETPVDGLVSCTVQRTVQAQIERVLAGRLQFAIWAVY